MINNIKEHQSIFYNLIYNANKENRRNHAYMLVGNNTKDAITFLTMSILCDETVACGTCNTCKRVINKSYADVIYYDGDIESIKKQHIANIKTSFIRSSVEGKSKIYILENIEKSSKEAMNSLLKMLEEPEGDTVAIFSTKNKAKVLPTIISRCQVIELKPDNKIVLKQKLCVENIQLAYTNLLAEISSTKEEAISKYDDRFIYMYNEVTNCIEDLYTKPENVLINIHTNLLMKYKTKDDIHLFFSMLLVALRDLLHYKYGQELVFMHMVEKYKMWDIQEEIVINRIQEVSLAKQKIDSNVNIGLLIDSLFYKL